MTHKSLIIAAASLIAAAGIAAGCGHPFMGNHDPERRTGYMMKMISSELNLNETQRVKLGEIKDGVMARFREIRDERRNQHGEMVALVKGPALTRDQLNRLAKTREDDYNRMKPYIIDRIVEFHAMLNQEQKNKLAELMEKKHKRHRRR